MLTHKIKIIHKCVRLVIPFSYELDLKIMLSHVFIYIRQYGDDILSFNPFFIFPVTMRLWALFIT